MRWNVRDNVPPLRGRGVKILLDGSRVDHVFALDTVAGWVDCFCTSIMHQRRGKTHANEKGNAPCVAPRRYGLVEIELPPGVAAEFLRNGIVIPNQRHEEVQ